MKNPFAIIGELCAHLLFALAVGAFLAACGGGGGGGGAGVAAPPAPSQPPGGNNSGGNGNNGGNGNGGGGGGGGAQFSQQITYIQTEALTLSLEVIDPSAPSGVSFQSFAVSANLFGSVVLTLTDIDSTVMSVMLTGRLLNSVMVAEDGNTYTLQSLDVGHMLPVSISLSVNVTDSGGVPASAVAVATVTSTTTMTINTVTTTMTVEDRVVRETITTTNDVTLHTSTTTMTVEDRVVRETITTTNDVTLHTSTTTMTVEDRVVRETITTTNDVTLHTSTVVMTTEIDRKPTATLVTGTITLSSGVATVKQTAIVGGSGGTVVEIYVTSVQVITVSAPAGDTSGTDYRYLAPNGEWLAVPDWLYAEIQLLEINLPARDISTSIAVVTNHVVTKEHIERVTVVTATNIITTTNDVISRVSETAERTVATVVTATNIITTTNDVISRVSETAERTVATVITATNIITMTNDVPMEVRETAERTVATVITATNTITTTTEVGYVVHTSTIERENSGTVTTHYHVLTVRGTRYTILAANDLLPWQVSKRNGSSVPTITYNLAATLYVDSKGTPATVVLPPPSIADTIDYNTAEYQRNWGLSAINAAPAYNRGYFGQGVTVAVVDSGIQGNHGNLSANVVPGGRASYDANSNVIIITNGHGYEDYNGHGTGVAGIIAGVMNGSVMHGVAPQAKVMPVQIFGGNGSRIRSYGDGSVREKTEVSGVAFALNRGVPIINNSYGRNTSITIRYLKTSRDQGLRDPDTRDYATFWVTAIAPNFPLIPEVFSAISTVKLAEDRSFIEMSLINDEIADKDAVMVWVTGNNELHAGYAVVGLIENTVTGRPSNDGIRITQFAYDSELLVDGKAYAMRDILPGEINSRGNKIPQLNHPDIMALAPLYYPGLLGKWVAVAGVHDRIRQGRNVNESERFLISYNACGRSKHWCLVAPGGDVSTAISNDGVVGRHPTSYEGSSNNYYIERSGTSFAAPHVSGALAVLRSRFPAMPMNAILAILLKSATDLGDNGVDPVYGHGLLNLGAAITVQGEMDLIIAGASDAAGSFTDSLTQKVTLPPLAPPISGNYNSQEYYVNRGLNLIRASVAYNHGYFGQSVTVAVVDSGVKTDHPDLNANIVRGARVTVDGSGSLTVVRASSMVITTPTSTITTWDIIDGLKPFGHGTGVAGVIAAAMDGVGMHGVAPQAKIMPIQTRGADGERVSDSNMVQVSGVVYALDNSVHIINNSYSFTFTDLTARYEREGATVSIVFEQFPAFPELFSIYVTQAINPFLHRISVINDEITDNDAVMVWSAGNGPWRTSYYGGTIPNVRVISDNAGSFVVSRNDFLDTGEFIADGDVHKVSEINLPIDNPQIMAHAPIYHPELVGKWVAVIGLDSYGRNNYIGSHGCGKAMHWCLAAPGRQIETLTNDNRQLRERQGTSYAAPHVSGALAVLKSRFPAMKMKHILAILFETADDDWARFGSQSASRAVGGVHPTYGHGILNLGAAITVQNAMTMPGNNGAGKDALAGNSGKRVLNFSDTQLAAGAGALARHLSGLSVAVGYLGGDYYFDAPLSSISDFKVGEEVSIGNAAADMLGGGAHRAGGASGAMALLDTHSGKFRRAGYAGESWRVEYDICTDCERASWHTDRAGGISSAHFGESQQGLGAAWSAGAVGVDELEIFSAMGLGEEGEEESYRQYGLRWHDTLSPWSSLSFMAEVSEIREENSLLGNSGDVFGFTPSRSRQARLDLSGDLGGWQWQGGYLHGWADTGVDGTGLVTEVSDIRYHQWHIEGLAKSLLQGEDEFRFGVTGLPRVRGLVKIDYYHASNEKFVDDFQFSLPTGVTARSLTLRELSDKALVWRMGYKWRPFDIRNMQAAVGVERVSGGASDGNTSASFQIRWDF